MNVAVAQLEIVPVHRDQARAFVRQHHRHSSNPPPSWKFGTSLELDGRVVAVGIAGRPVAVALQDGRTIEMARICTLGDRNACSMLYGALCRAAKALGYRRAITYTLQSESGSSLRAAGFVLDQELDERAGWNSPSRPRVEVDLFGEERRVEGPRNRWVRYL